MNPASCPRSPALHPSPGIRLVSLVMVFLLVALFGSQAGYGYTSGQFLTGSNQDNNYNCAAVGPGGVFYGAWKANNPAPSYIKFATFNGSTWTQIATASFTGTSVAAQLPGLDSIADWGPESMAVDASGNIHIIFGVSASAGGINSLRGLAYGKYTAATTSWAFRRLWIFQDPSGWKNVGNGEYCLKLDASGNPHVTMKWSAAGPHLDYLKYGFFNGTVWNVTGTTNADDGVLIDQSPAGSQELSYPDMTFDSAGVLHCVYEKEQGDHISGDAWYSKLVSGSWTAPVNIAAVGNFYGGSIVVDASNFVSIGDITQASYGAASFNFRVITNATGSFVAGNVASYTVPTSTSTYPGYAIMKINSAGRRVIGVPLNAANGATALAPQYRLAYETAPGVWAQETAFTDDTLHALQWGCMTLRTSDNTVMGLFARADADYTPDVRNSYFTTGVPAGIGGGGAVAPTVTTDTQTNVTFNSATLGGNVTADGGASVSERGIVWNTSTGPTTSNNKVQNGSGTGTFSGTVNSLPSSSTIYVRAYAINTQGTAYGNEISFATPAPPAPEIAVSGLGSNIPDGNTAIATADDTDFGSVPVQGVSVTHTFTVMNSGTANLTLGTVGLTGGGAAHFAVTQPLTSTVIPSGSTTFTVTYDPSAAATHTATVSFTSNDGNESPFDFNVQGVGTGPRTFDLAGNPVSNTPFDTGDTYIYSAGPPPPLPVGGNGTDVVTGGNATDGTGATDGTQFDQLQRSGFLAENGTLAFLGYLKTGVGGVDATNFMGYWKSSGSSLTRIARQGFDAPETGATAAKFNILPLIPGINDDGQVTLFASLLQSTLSSPVTDADNDTGLWSELGGTGFQILMRENDIVPNTSGAQAASFGYGCFATTKTSANTGEAAFVVGLKGSSTDTALLRTSVVDSNTTAVGVIARENVAAPGGGGDTFNLIHGGYTGAARMDATGNVVFAGWLKPSNKTGIWYQDQTTKVVSKTVLAGETAPGTTATFQSIDLPNMGGNGTYAFRAVLNQDGDNSTNAKNDGIWKGTGTAAPALILRRGDAALPGMPVGSKVGNIYNGWLTNANHGAWLGWVDTAGDGISAYPADTFGIYTDTSGTMRLLISSGDAAPGVAGATMFFIDHPVCGGAEQVAFIGTLTGGGVSAGINDKGVWRTSSNGGALSLVLRTGDTMSVSINGATTTKTIANVDIPGSGYAEHIWETPVMDATGRLLIFVTFTDNSTTQVIVP